MAQHWLIDRMAARGDSEAIIWKDEKVTYAELLRLTAEWTPRLDAADVAPGTIVSIVSGYSPNACALLLALMLRKAIVVPIASAAGADHENFFETAQVQLVISLDDSDKHQMQRRSATVSNPLLTTLIANAEPGLVLFSSGSTGKSKAALHSLDRLMEKNKKQRHSFRTLTFLLLDHIGGINTLLYTLSNGGTVITVEKQDAETVCQAIHAHRVELLPTSPTFLRMLLLSGAYQRFDLSSLKMISYGTEVMPNDVLAQLRQAFPEVKLLQTYGLTEVGILSSASPDSGSLWLKLGGEGFETKVVDNVLWVKARSAMLGYLNAPSPFEQDGWMNTRDVVEVKGDTYRILGRETDIINVGGLKVYPAEVETVLEQCPNIKSAIVRGEKSPITGQIVTAQVALIEPEPEAQVRTRLKEYCASRLDKYKIPLKITVTDQEQASRRFKKLRRSETT